ncbi:MAG: dihydrodipicolinate synthase family protein [Rhodospirillales bacterium]
MGSSVEGVVAAVLTPLDADLAPDRAAMVRHCRWLRDHGCDGLSVLGTTGEANSFSVDERERVLEALIEDGIPGTVLLPGTGCCALTDTVRLTRKALELGVAGVLMLPPFYYKNVSDDGLFASYAEVVERIGDPRLRIYLYQFPQMSGVFLGHELIDRLLKRYPGVIAGIKDSSGDVAAMIRNARSFPGLAVFSGSDEFLLPLLQNGGAGCITALANVAASLAAEVVFAWRQGDHDRAATAQVRLTAVRNAVSALPLTAALKEMMARHAGDDGWRRVRPPLTELAATGATDLFITLDSLRFSPPPAP